MGTNYYWHESGERRCPHCDQETPSRHIGKSSMGWCFSLHVYPADGIVTLDDWRAKWASGGAIFDEYGDRVSVPEMETTIHDRGPVDRLRRHQREPWGLDVRPGGVTYDLCNYDFS